MNRRERRRAVKKGDVIFTDCGHLLEGDPNYGLSVKCYVCGALHTGLGVARIRHGRTTVHVPLCEPCGAVDDPGRYVLRKFLNAPTSRSAKGAKRRVSNFGLWPKSRPRRSIELASVACALAPDNTPSQY
jgi:hypothetical protein